jgi:hypothetical protein
MAVTQSDEWRMVMVATSATIKKCEDDNDRPTATADPFNPFRPSSRMTVEVKTFPAISFSTLSERGG